MKKILLILTIAIFSIGFSKAQVTDKEKDLKVVKNENADGWKKGGLFSLTFGQAGFTNWAAGGINNVSLNGLSSLFAKYKKGKLTWDNTLDLGYGTQRLGKGNNAQNQKTDDKIDFSSKLGLKATDKLYYAALGNFKTQFAEGLDYSAPIKTVISDLMSPAYLLVAAGIDYRPNENLSVFIAPVTSKITFVKNQTLADAGAFGVDLGANIKNEFGGYLKAVYKKDVMKNVNFNTKLGLFSNYLNKPQNIDIDWEVLIGMKINKFLTANISTQLLYDDDVKISVYDDNGVQTGHGARIQFKEILGIGFSIKF